MTTTATASNLQRAAARRRQRAGATAVLLPVVAAVSALVLWHFAVVVARTEVFPPPLEVATALVELARRGVLLPYVRDSLARVAAGYGLALVLGLPLGIAMGWWRGLGRSLDPVVQLLRPISPIAWIPVSIVLFGVSERGAVFLVFLAAFFPIVMAATNGVAGVPSIFLRAGRNLGLGPVALLRRVVFPAALPRMLVGLRIGIGVAWLVVVAAEMVAIDSGLGYLIVDARNAGKRYDLVVGAMLVIGVIGLVLDLVVRCLERLPSLRWGFRRQ